MLLWVFLSKSFWTNEDFKARRKLVMLRMKREEKKHEHTNEYIVLNLLQIIKQQKKHHFTAFKHDIWREKKPYKHTSYVMRTPVASANNRHVYNWKIICFCSAMKFILDSQRSEDTADCVHNVTFNARSEFSKFYLRTAMKPHLWLHPNNVNFWLIKFTFRLEPRHSRRNHY